MGWIAALLLSVVVLAEDISVPIPLAPYPSGSRLPTVYHWLAVQSPRGVLIELPIDNVSSHAQAYVYFSLFHHWTIVNGWRSFIPPAYHDILKSA